MKKKYLLPALMFLMVMMGCGGGGDITSVLSSTKAITAFSLGGVSGTIDETGKTISVFMPKDTDVTALVATFTTTGSSVKVCSAPQFSGTTDNDFSSAKVYTVTAADGTTQNYTVTVTVSTSKSGFPDTTFGTNGIVKTDIDGRNDYALAMAIQADRKIVVAGYSYNDSNCVFALARYEADGSLDTDFGSGGRVTTAIGSGKDLAYALAIQNTGEILVAGTSNNGNKDEFAVVRYKTDGSLDPTFGSDGKVTTSIGSADDVARALGIQSDGKIVVAGYSKKGSKNEFAVVRYKTDGSLDATFGPDLNGKVTTSVGSGYDIAYTLGIQSNDMIVVAGVTYNGSNHDFAVVRYDKNGSPDPGFGSSGIVTTDIDIGKSIDIAYTLAIQDTGEILVAGASNNGSKNEFAVVRYKTDGSRDATFGTNGIVTTAVGNSFSAASALAIQPDDKIVVAGLSYDAFNTDFALVRYKTDGSLDTDFYVGGIVTTSIGGEDVVGAVRVQAGDGKIVAAGYSNYDFALIRYWP